MVNDVAKIHIEDPTVNDHAIIFKETDFRIPLALWGIFSYFPTSKPSSDDHDAIDDVYVLTPTSWNPHSDVYARNEENMVDWEGNMVQAKDRVRLLMEDVADDPAMAAVVQIGSVESSVIDSALEDRFDSEERRKGWKVTIRCQGQRTKWPVCYLTSRLYLILRPCAADSRPGQRLGSSNVLLGQPQ